jgi:hypothetical protein
MSHRTSLHPSVRRAPRKSDRDAGGCRRSFDRMGERLDPQGLCWRQFKHKVLDKPFNMPCLLNTLPANYDRAAFRKRPAFSLPFRTEAPTSLRSTRHNKVSNATLSRAAENRGLTEAWLRFLLSQAPNSGAPGAPIFSGCAHFAWHPGHPPKIMLDTGRKSTTIWLWIGWIQHLRLCPIPPAGR